VSKSLHLKKLVSNKRSSKYGYVTISLVVLILIIIALILLGSTRAIGPFNETVRLVSSAPSIDIKKVFYINMDESTERNQQFLTNYNGQWPLQRISGVRTQTKHGNLPLGTVGCALAHANALQAVFDDATSRNVDSWYIVCEDDCIIKDFNLIATNDYIRSILAQKKQKKYINLTRKSFTASHSVNAVNNGTVAYLIHSSYAYELKDLIIKMLCKGWPIDFTTMTFLKKKMLPFLAGNDKGCYVNLMNYSNGPSERLRIDAARA